MFLSNLVKLFLLLINVVVCSDTINDAYKQIDNISKDRKHIYKHNHPPEEAIPVAIVFEENGGREGKSIDRDGSRINLNIETDKNTNDVKPPHSTTISSAKANDTDKATVKSLARNNTTEENLQIPVAVIYEKESTSDKNKDLQGSKNQNQGHLNRRPLQNVSTKKTTTGILPGENKSSITTKKITEDKEAKQTSVSEPTKVHQKSRERTPVVPIVQSENKVFGHNGDFRYSYEGGDGTQVFGTGELKSYDDDKKGEAVVGGFSYTDKDGQEFSLSYTADENGYRPVGAHLPTPPPIPPAIERALRYLATKTTPEPVTDSILKRIK